MKLIPDGYTAKEVIGQLDSLRMTEAWKVFTNILQDDIASKEAQILDDTVETIAHLQRLQDERRFMKYIIDLPSFVIRTLLETNEIPNDDPYYTGEEMKESTS